MRLAIGSVGSNLVLPLAGGKEGEKEKEVGVASIDSIGRTVREMKGGELSCFQNDQLLFRSSMNANFDVCLLSAEMDPLAQFCR